MKKLIYFTILTIIITVSSCKTDVELNAPWKETPVVYGLLEPLKDTQFIKINKCFLGSKDAYVMAKNPDSLNYPYKLNVRVEKWNNGTLTKTYNNLDTITLPNMNDGIFAENKNLAYFFKTPKTSDPIDYNATYKLIIENPHTKLVASSSTLIIQPFTVNDPFILRTNGYASQTLYKADFGYAKVNFNFYVPQNGKLFEIYARLNYIEYHPGVGDSVQKYLDLLVGRFVETNGVGSTVSTMLDMESFYTSICSGIPKDASINRKLGKRGNLLDQINYRIICAAENLSTYIDVKKPSSSIVQDKPDPTNITNGLGIFSSRYVMEINDLYLDAGSVKYLQENEASKDLNFK